MARTSKSFRERIQHFTPSWFAVTMGIGVHISLFHVWPFPAGHQDVLDYFSTVVLVFNTILFLIMTGMTIARYVMYPHIWKLMIHHPVQSLFVGCFPMAMATIVNGLVIQAHQKFHLGGDKFLYFIWALWWLDVALSLLSNFGMFHVMVTRHTYELPKSSAIWLLPVVPSVVAGTSGAIVANALQAVNRHYALLTVLVSCVLLALGLTMSLAILALYIQRLILHGFPTAGLAVSVFLPLGPLGQGGYGMILVGDLLVSLLPQSTSPEDFLAYAGVASALRVILFFIAVVLWAFGIWFLIPAAVAIATSPTVPFGLPWWGLIFPSGVYTLLTIEIGVKLNSVFIKVVGTIYTVIIFMLLVVISARTGLQLGDGSIFHAPCLDDYPLPPPADAKDEAADIAVSGNAQAGEQTPVDDLSVIDRPVPLRRRDTGGQPS